MALDEVARAAGVLGHGVQHDVAAGVQVAFLAATLPVLRSGLAQCLLTFFGSSRLCSLLGSMFSETIAAAGLGSFGQPVARVDDRLDQDRGGSGPSDQLVDPAVQRRLVAHERDHADRRLPELDERDQGVGAGLVGLLDEARERRADTWIRLSAACVVFASSATCNGCDESLTETISRSTPSSRSRTSAIVRSVTGRPEASEDPDDDRLVSRGGRCGGAADCRHGYDGSQDSGPAAKRASSHYDASSGVRWPEYTGRGAARAVSPRFRLASPLEQVLDRVDPSGTWHSPGGCVTPGKNIRRPVRETGFYPLRAVELRDITSPDRFVKRGVRCDRTLGPRPTLRRSNRRVALLSAGLRAQGAQKIALVTVVSDNGSRSRISPRRTWSSTRTKAERKVISVEPATEPLVIALLLDTAAASAGGSIQSRTCARRCRTS